MIQTVKVQYPLTPGHGEPCMVYDRPRKHTQVIPFENIPAHLQAPLRDRLKVFCEAEWHSGGKGWTLIALAPVQDW